MSTEKTIKFWQKKVGEIYQTKEGVALVDALKSRNKKGIKLVPENKQVFRALRELPHDGVNVIIVGQDPYPSGGHANGLAFASDQEKTPVSLKILFQIISSWNKNSNFMSNNLQKWVDQGVLLMNSALSVEEHKAGSLQDEWAPVVVEILREVHVRNPKAVFLSFGKKAEAIVKAAAPMTHLHVQCYHPSYIARTGYDIEKIKPNPFAQVNEMLKSVEKKPIDWNT